MRKLMPLLLLAPLALAACGGSSGVGASPPLKVDPVAYVKHSAKKTATAPSEHMTMTMTMTVAGQKITAKGSGDYINNPPQGTFDMSMSLMGQNMTFNAVEDGTTMYMQSPMLTSKLPAGKTWAKIDLQKANAARGIDTSSLMSQNPAQALQRVEAAGTVKSLGTETIDGVETTHYQVTNIDVSKLPQGSKIQAMAHPTYGPMDVWIGNSDGYVYRETVSFSYSVMGQKGSADIQVDLSDFGKKVTVTVPPANDVFDATNLSTGGLGG